MTDPEDPTRTEGETLDLPEGMRGFAQGQILGERYQILEMLGRGGMGEVWHAFDLKLRVEVALKALRPEFFKSERRLELLRQEVRAAREVVSPNVCRIFDLIEVEGRELVSMEYVDGATLLAVLQERGPLDLKEAQDIASQFLAGLEAIHKVGLIHRDIKPENIMLTRAGRVVVMDFGLARQETEGGGTVAGTPAYMAPEQAAGQTLDARADVYAAGVVLAEMVCPEGIKSIQSRQSVWEGVRSEPAKVPDTPWAAVIKKAVAKDREGRHNSAHTLTRALEDVTLRVEGAEDLHPYPGLASFTEADAEYFFGREAEVEQMWRKLEGATRMLAIVGPSGAGKTSFLQAGLLAHGGPDWACLICEPAHSPQLALSRALAPEMAGDIEAMDLLLRFDEPEVATEVVASWRRRTTHAVIVVDQFEELFTQNGLDEQRRFCELLSEIVLRSDVHVLLSMRDDFLMRCHDHEPLAPLFSDLTPLRAPTGDALRRALVQPATKCGYRFEDDELVNEMLTEVEGERGALPLLAFAAARLWEMRDRETGLLTRQAYQDIGGVGGALARHAEATIDRIGSENLPVVREVFRNLVTAEGTRAVREWRELLSVFEEPQRDSAAEVLSELIDARLLTSYEIHEDERESTRRVEIIHESLLANWPRLVRWQTQDQEGAQLRDELRQAARAWGEHGQQDDRLWTGTAYREFELWRERYPGRLTTTEEAFAEAMTSLATRRRRRRRIVVAAALVVLAAVASILGSMWAKSERETRRAEASELLALGQLELDSYPSATVAYAITSLELTDSEAARRLALEALWQGPTALVASEDFAWETRFSPDGGSLVKGTNFASDTTDASNLTIFSADGSSTPLVDVHPKMAAIDLSRISASGYFVSSSFATTSDSSQKIVVWHVDNHRPIAEIVLDPSQVLWRTVIDSARKRVVILSRENDLFQVDTLGFDGEKERLGTLEFKTRRDESGMWTTYASIDPRTAAWIGVVSREQVFVVDVGDRDLGPPRLIGRHEGAVSYFAWDPLDRFIVTAAKDGYFRFWSLTDQNPPLEVQGPPNTVYFDFTQDGFLFSAAVEEDDTLIVWVWDTEGDQPQFLRKIDIGGSNWGFYKLDDSSRYLARYGPDSSFRLWSLTGPADADPIVLRRGDNDQANDLDFNPKRDWLATTDLRGLVVWPLARDYPFVIQRHEGSVGGLAFAPDGSWVASSSDDGTVRIWPLAGQSPPQGSIRYDAGNLLHGLAVSPDGQKLVVGAVDGKTALLSLDGNPPTILTGFSGQTWGVDFSPDGQRVAAVGGQFNLAERAIRIWDVASGAKMKVLEIDEPPNVFKIEFLPNNQLLSATDTALVRWDIETGTSTRLYEGMIFDFAASADGRRVLMVVAPSLSENSGEVVLLDTGSVRSTHLEKFGRDVRKIACDPTASVIATGDKDGEVRVGLIDGGEPYLFTGHERPILTAIDPLGRWVASGGNDFTVRLWPMPDLSKRPLHALPREELIAKLKTLTNLRAVRDEDSPTGWKIEVGPFPGWETVPEW